ncbi:hypothetical protein QJR52_05935 [Clostridium baratii]|uniref:hypothetical protein n=1 Tax=Clostridium baratii TaxID=1561 RepID=UPI0030CD0EC0
MPIPVITSIISAISILAGSALGAWFSWVINNKMHSIRIKEEQDIIKDNRKYEEKYKIKEVCKNANSIRLDICTAIYQSIRFIVNKDSIEYVYPISINKTYSCSVASLSDKYTIKELSYIYQLYGIIEKVNSDILKYQNNGLIDKEKVIDGFDYILKKVYGDNKDKIINLDIDRIKYNDLFENEYIKEGYKYILRELDKSSKEENLLK